MENRKAVRINSIDSVAVALEPLKKGETFYGATLKEDIPQGHKFAIIKINCGEKVIKYGCPIGKATVEIEQGYHVHIHNMKTLLSENAEYKYEPVFGKELSSTQAITTASIQKRQQFIIPDIMAYERENGSIGIRNEIWIVPTVGCVNKLAETLAYRASEKHKNASIDGIYAWTHPYGCSQMGSDHMQTRKVLADLVNHPNAGAVLVLGLGCENNTITEFRKIAGGQNEKRIIYLTAQDYEDEIEAGLKAIDRLVEYASSFKRQKVSANRLVIGMKCGGSDGLSGITANALVGQVCDIFTQNGCRVLLTEVPEMFGAEQLLMNRCINRTVFDKTVQLINSFKDYFIKHGQTVYENPSPGNKAGGITTLEDKSLGCIQKSGCSPIAGVLRYGEQIDESTDNGGVYLLEGPGNDIVSTTAMTASGAHIILFTTGRGTPLGAPVPTIKIASNHMLAEKKHNWIDFDASEILKEGDKSSACFIESGTTAKNLIELVLQIVSGKKQTKNEINNYKEIAILKEGVTL